MTKQKSCGIILLWLLMLAPYAQGYEFGYKQKSMNDRLRKAEVLRIWLDCVPYVEVSMRDGLSKNVGFITHFGHMGSLMYGSLCARSIALCIEKVTGANPLCVREELKKEYPFWSVGYEFLAHNLLRYAVIGVSKKAICSVGDACRHWSLFDMRSN